MVAPFLDTIIFDYGGVICTARRSRRFARWSHELHGTDEEEVFRRFNADLAQAYTRGEVSPETFYLSIQEAGVPMAWEEIRHKLASFGSPDPEMKALLTNLASQGYDLAILSNSSPELTAVARQHLQGLFRVEIFSEEVGMSKPFPPIYDLALERIGRPAGFCLFIDDQEVNLAYPASVGVQVHRFTTPQCLKEALAQTYRIVMP